MLPRNFLGNNQNTISWEMKRSEHEADHSHPPSAKVKDEESCFSTPPYISQSAKYNKIIHIYSVVLPDSAERKHNITWYSNTWWLFVQTFW